MPKPALTDADRAAVSQSIKHARLVDASRKLARIVRHVDPPPNVKAARTRLEKSLTAWMLHHGGAAFDRPFSDDHKRCIAKIEAAGNSGGMFALAMPRGHGKSTMLKWATLYFMLTGRRHYVVIVAATAELAQTFVDFARQQIQESETLHAHYPHVTTYARATDGKAIKAKYQLRADGKTSGILWSKTTLVLPEILDTDGKPYPSNGCILEGHGLTGAIRGKWRDTKSGRTLRPDFVLLDDPQTRESAESEAQCKLRERIITGDVLGLAGPRKRIAAVMPCTITRKGDLAARFLSHETHPEWQGETCALVRAWPEAQDTLWQEYGRVFRDEGLPAATEFYRARRADMDKGAAVSWEHRVRDGELSAIQTAENLLIESGDQFWAEYQNDPKEEGVTVYTLTPKTITDRTDRGRAAGAIPEWAQLVVAATDINPSYALSTAIVGFGQDQRAALLWYGLHRMAVPDELPPAQKRAAIMLELERHGKALAVLPCRPERWMIDGGGSPEETVITFAALAQRTTGLEAVCAFGRSWQQCRPKTADRRFEHGYLHAESRVRRWVIFNSDYWREVQQRAWLGAIGAPGSCDLPRGNHQDFAEQVCRVWLIDKAPLADGWAYKWGRAEPHDFCDCMTMCFAAAAMGGIGTGGIATKPANAPARVLSSRPSGRR